VFGVDESFCMWRVLLDLGPVDFMLDHLNGMLATRERKLQRLGYWLLLQLEPDCWSIPPSVHP
jgi:hypothetical protein